MKIDVAIIGGTGIGDRLSALGGSPIVVPTEFGPARGTLIQHDDAAILLVKRHSAGHKTPPHAVNYRAIATGLRSVGVKACFSSAAVGSLRREWGPGTLVNCHDFVDLTSRNLTLFDRKVVHTDFTTPFDPICRRAIEIAASRTGIALEPRGIYICGNGPRYETPHEIDLFQAIGDLVGMTAATEAIAMREAGVPYGCLAVVTNLAAGISETPLDHQEVVDEMNRSGERAVAALLDAAVEVSRST